MHNGKVTVLVVTTLIQFPSTAHCFAMPICLSTLIKKNFRTYVCVVLETIKPTSAPTTLEKSIYRTNELFE